MAPRRDCFVGLLFRRWKPRLPPSPDATAGAFLWHSPSQEFGTIGDKSRRRDIPTASRKASSWLTTNSAPS
jgi:hypothetical protein